MSDKTAVAVTSMKAAQSELVQWENRLEFIKSEIATHSKTRDALKAEIEKKTSDYSIWMAAKDAENKKNRADNLTANDKLDSDKKEFVGMLQSFQKEKALFAQERIDHENDKKKLQMQKDQVNQFIIAVQRAFSVIGG